ncbi:hypothetical protein PISMIDRAFT_677986 [Pisolithus microcarpus 441]|uniref:Uncharacterized protein n=1 Tax=Pisolithus microcarpus 441 TaxID=765257 RepID=A0A0C9ZRI1_9AGAM|nr:hypothetical protein PISMIDRAFT_677986 [Pisolithus microcarpus 441]
MSEDDAAYTQLLTQLLSDSSSTRNARVHSWIEHQYDFALSEQDPAVAALNLSHSRSPSPSPSSSLGAHRTFSVDRPDSPLLPRSSADSPSSPRLDACPSYDTLFFPQTPPSSEEDQHEERERERALKFIVQEMAAHLKIQSVPSTPSKHTDKPLPAPPPSPATSISQSTSPRALRSRSSSMRISRLPSFTSTLSSDQTSPQDVFVPPLPVSVIVHGESQHDLVLRHEHAYPDGYPPAKKDFYPHQEQDAHLFAPQDDKDSVFPSPTLSNFSYAFSRETSITTPNTSFPASPASVAFGACCLPENANFPASSDIEQSFSETPPASAEGDGTVCRLSPSHTALPSSPVTTVGPASPTAASFQSSTTDLPMPCSVSAQSTHLRAIMSGVQSESRWSIATTVSSEGAKPSSFLSPRTPPRGKKHLAKELKTPKHRTRFIDFISRLSPGRNDPSATTSSVGSAVTSYDEDVRNDSDEEGAQEKCKPNKNLNKKASLASLRLSFSLSRASISGQRPSLSSPSEEVPPLPISPTRTSNSGEPYTGALTEGMNPAPPTRSAIPRVPSRGNLLESMLPPIPSSASTVTSFRNASQVSLAQPPLSSAASASRTSLLPSPTIVSSNPTSINYLQNGNTSHTSLLPPPTSKRVSFQSDTRQTLGSGADDVQSIHPMNSSPPPMSLTNTSTPSRAKSIFRLTSKPKSVKVRSNVIPVSVSSPASRPKLPVPGAHSQGQGIQSSSNQVVTSGIPPPTKFTPPKKLASVLAGQAPPPPCQPKIINVPGTNTPLRSPVSPPSKSKLPLAPSKIAKSPSSKTVRSMMGGIKVPVYPADGQGTVKVGAALVDNSVGASKLPLPASSQKAVRVGTVRGFWKR